jgi:cell division protein FtsI (penicillin-binding protein 3)
MGQEIGVTPLQLVSMVSTIANGGTYLPPHVLMTAQPQNSSEKSAAPQVPQPIKLNEDLPNPLPSGAHRVISELAAAQMRKMMEGVVLNGTGKDAQLNGYSSGGKTGTAQKVDPATHTYSKTMHIASFAGIAPVNNPVIAVAIVMDNPKAGSYYGAAVSAPVFAEVAQQVLEYLGVPHDEPVRPGKLPKEPRQPTREDDHDETGEDINALYAAVNDLPNDDELRSQPAQAASAAQPSNPKPAATASTTAQAISAQTSAVPAPVKTPPAAQPHTVAISVVKPTRQVKVPSFVGMSMRQVIETAAGAGLEVQVAGSGTIREQAPVAGAMVAPGTRVVVRGTH